MTELREFFSEVKLDGVSLAAIQQGQVRIQDRNILKEFLEYVHIAKGLLAPYTPAYPLVEARELTPSFEKNFAENKDLPSFSMVALNRTLSYQEEIFQFDILHPQVPEEGKRRPRHGNLDKIIPHLDRDFRPPFRLRFSHRDLTDLANYEELLPFLFHMDRAHVMAKDDQGVFRLLGVYASFPSDLDTELKAFGFRLGKFRKLDNVNYERERDFVYQFLMELYGYPIASERRTSAALFARKLSRLKEPYLIKVLGSSDRTITSMSGFEQKKYPLVEKTALITLPPGLVKANPHLRDQGYFVDPERGVVILKVTYQQHKYNRFNVLEDRALSVLKQELIHPYHGGRDLSLNLLKDTRRSLKELTDIVRGEFLGSITYKGSELLTSTKTHEERLKFLSAWLAKNQRRLGAYSRDTFDAAKKVLNSYLLSREHREAFAKYQDLHREVVGRIAYLTEAQQLQTLEKLVQGDAGGRNRGASHRLALALTFLEERQFDLPYYYPDLFEKCLNLFDQILSYPQFKKLTAGAEPPKSSVRRRVWDMLVRGRQLLSQLRHEHCRMQAEIKRGTPFPLVSVTPRQPAPPASKS